MVVVVDQEGRAHGWDVQPAMASWRMTGISPSGDRRTTVHIDIDGPMRRRTRDLDAVLKAPELDWVEE